MSSAAPAASGEDNTMASAEAPTTTTTTTTEAAAAAPPAVAATAQVQGQGQQGPRTLWMGDLAYWMDENFLMSLFASTGEMVSTKIIRNKVTGYSEGYGFIEFSSHAVAQNVLQTYNGVQIAGTDQFFKLNWASGGDGGRSSGGGGHGQAGSEGQQGAGGSPGRSGGGHGASGGGGQEHSVFVGDLSSEVTDYMLQDFFRQYYPSVKSARVVTDAVTGRPKGYGFVRFASEADRDKAMVQMNGQVVGSRAIRVSLATPKRSQGGMHHSGGPGGQSGYQSQQNYQPVGIGMASYAGMMGMGMGGLGLGMGQMGQLGQMGQMGMHGGGGADQRQHQHGGGSSGNTTLYIGGIHPSTAEEDIRVVFSGFGEIVYIKIATAKACAFVQFAHRASAEKALVATNGQMIKGNAVRVSWGRHSEPKGMSAMNSYQQQMQGYYGYYYNPNQFYGYSMPMQNPAAMVHQQQMQGMMPQQQQQQRQQQVGQASQDATKPASSIEELNERYASMTGPYTLESNAFISSVPPSDSTSLPI